MKTLQDVSNYWFETPNDYNKWFMSGSTLDAYLITHYKSLLDYYRNPDTPNPIMLRDKLLLIILLDQFSRHIYRDNKKSFDMDEKTRVISLQLLDSGGINLLDTNEQLFALMPLQHSENISDLDTLLLYLSKQPSKRFSLFIDHTKKHREVLVNFGRYPKRNEVLGRVSTQEELEYIKKTPDRPY